MLISLFQKYYRVIIINEISYIGDSIVFFWPLVNGFVSAFPEKAISVFHLHSNLFKPASKKIYNGSLVEFYEDIKADENTLVIAFIKSDGLLKAHLKQNGFYSIVKGMVGLDFTALNFADISVFSQEFDRVYIDNKEIKCVCKNRDIDSESGFPVLSYPFSNVYDYAKVCNESFFGLKEMDIPCVENIIIHEFDSRETYVDLFVSPPTQDRKYILINLICGTFKEDVQENYSSLVNWIKEVAAAAEKDETDVWLLVDKKFPSLRNDLSQHTYNLFYLKEQSSLYWTNLMKLSEKNYSIDTGFLHIAHILNKNTFGFGGSVDFWFFKDKTIKIEDYKLTDYFADIYYPDNKTIVDLFEEQVAKTPNAVAIKFKNTELTYRELNEKSNQLAHYLITNYSIQPDDLVGIELGRSEWMVIGILGIIKSGGAYVPIDPEYPEQRKSFIKEDASFKVTINDYELDKFSQANKNNAYSNTNPNIELSPSNLMYVIYTSGTTGNPKGVLIEHKNVVRLLFNDAFQFDFSSSDVWTMFHNFNFDFSVWELYGALLYGGKLVIVSSEVAKDTHSFADLLIAEDVTVLNQTPSAFYNLSEVFRANQPDNHHHLRYVIFGGEALQPSKLEWWYQNYPKTNLVNMYGITETTVHVTYQEIGSKEIAQGVSIIGKPIPTLSCYIMDEQRQLCAIGQEGELYVGGLGVARGYLNRPELTKEKFIDNPYKPGDRLYRTGDLGRWREDGNLEYLGRMDDQVKIRGYRIELGEIEQAISSHKSSGQALVISRAINNASDKELIAYTTGEATAEDLKAYLKERLHQYMVPNYYVMLDSIPLTSNGKVDRKSLPDPEGTGLKQGEYLAPQTSTEKQLVKIWSEVLGTEEDTLSIKADFFDLGGHSIKAIRLLGQTHKHLGVKLALKELFANPTIEQLGKLISKSTEKEIYTAIPTIQESDDYAVSSAQRRLWVLSKFDGANEAYNIPQVVRLEGSLNEQAFSKSYQSLLTRHEVLRTIFTEDAEGNPRQRVLPIGDERFNVIIKDFSKVTDSDRSKVAERPPSGLAGSRSEEYVSEEISRGFNLAEGPLIRCSLLKETDSSYVWVLVMHHIVSDGWSMGVLHKEWSELYNAALENRAANLPPLSIQYKDYAAWHNAQLQSEEISKHKNYWLEQFKGELPVLELPSDKPRPKVMTYNGASVYRELDKKTTDNLKAFSQQQGGTMFMTLQTALNILLHKYTGQEDIVIGSPIAGREHPDLEGQIGFYVNTLAIRNQFSKEDTVPELYQKIKQNTLGAYSHQVYPYDELVDALNLTRDTSRNPLFDVMISYMNREETELRIELKNTSLSGFDTSDQIIISAKFDLDFSFYEEGDQLYFSLIYNKDIYSETQVNRLTDSLIVMLNNINSHKDTAVKEVQLLAQKEIKNILSCMHCVDSESGFKTVLDAFYEQVRKQPGNVAVCFRNTEITFSELDKFSNQLARYLLGKCNLQRGELIVIELEKTHYTIIALLAALKLGVCFVPLDSDYPEELKQHVLSDTSCKFKLDSKIINEFLSSQGLYSDESIDASIKENDLMYCIYTSGSTGCPKGVLVEHRSVLNIMEAWEAEYNIAQEDCVLQLASFSFDVFIGDLCRSIFIGAKLIICPEELKFSSIDLIDLIKYQEVSMIEATPAFLVPLLDEVTQKQIDLPSLRCIVFGSDTIDFQTFKKHSENFNDLLVVNSFGTTETAIDSSYYVLVEGNDEEKSTPIGKPFKNNFFILLNADLQIVPYGSIGEICIGGVGLARGYLNREELTKEKFIENPYNPTERLYRTGDLGRWREDGNLEYLGRMDDQVKIRGYRIELGEIEQAISTHDKSGQAVVIARAINNATDKELIAYTTGEATAEELKIYLKERLPIYMVPNYYVKLESIPLTSNGKVDRKALPDPEGTGMQQAIYLAPNTETEKKLLKIWAEVLGADTLSIKADFFDLGGNSLKAIRLITKIHQSMNIRLMISDLFFNSDLESLSRLLDGLNVGVKSNFEIEL